MCVETEEWNKRIRKEERKGGKGKGKKREEGKKK
jgi:hypothetical protein